MIQNCMWNRFHPFSCHFRAASVSIFFIEFIEFIELSGNVCRDQKPMAASNALSKPTKRHRIPFQPNQLMFHAMAINSLAASSVQFGREILIIDFFCSSMKLNNFLFNHFMCITESLSITLLQILATQIFSHARFT